MNLTEKKPEVNDAPDMTPFIDCVFLLIVFFMACSRFVTQEYESLALPEAKSGQAELPKKKSKVVVNINPAGEFVVSNTSHTQPTLKYLFNKEIQRNDGAENVIVLVRADRESRFEDIQRLMATCASAGIWQLSFAVIEEPAP